MELPPQQPQQSYLAQGQPFALPSLSGAPMMLPSLSAQAAPMLPSMDPSMPDNVASQYGQQILQQGVAQIQQMMLMSQDFSTQMRRQLQDLSGVSSNIGQINALLAGTLQGLRQTAASAQSGVIGGYGGGGSGAAPTEGAAPGGGSPGYDPSQTEGADTRSLQQRFSEGRSMANRQSMTGVSRRMAGVAAQALQAKTGTWETEADENGNLNFHGADGTITDSMPATEENIAKAEQYGARTQRATGLLGRYAQGESLLGGEGGLLGGLGSGMLKAAGPVGLAVGVASAGFHQFASQTEAGTQYRAAYGQDAGRFAITQRAGADLAGVGGYLTGIGFGRAKQNYETAASMGLTGDRLHEGTDFMNSAYLKYGLDTQTSSQAVQISAQNANISLQSLGDQIGKVSEAAVAAGKNSEVAITSFLNVTQQVQQGVTNTAAAPVLSGQLSTAMSQNLATSLNTPGMASSFAGLITQQNIGMVAARTGQDFRTLSQQVATGQGNAPQQIVGQTLGFAVQDICRAAGTTEDSLKAFIKQKFGNVTNLAPEMQMQVLQQFPNLTPSIVQGIFGQYGMNVAPGDAMTLFFNSMLSDITNFGQAGSAGGATSATGAPGSASQILGDSGALSSAGMKALGIDVDPGVASAAGGRAAAGIGMANTAKMNSGPIKEYTDFAQAGGTRDMAAEALIRKQSTVTSFTGQGSLDDVKFKAQDGKMYTFSQILKDPSLMSQLDAGTMILQGKNKNDVQTVGDITGYTGAGGSPTGAGAGAPLGGGYTISLSPAAQRLFNLAGPNTSQSSGTPPMGSVAPNSYAR